MRTGFVRKNWRSGFSQLLTKQDGKAIKLIRPVNPNYCNSVCLLIGKRDRRKSVKEKNSWII